MRVSGLVAVALALLASACGGKGSENADDGDCSGLPEVLCGGSRAQPPPAQGAFAWSLKPISPAPAGKACPSAAAFTSEVPTNGGLDADTYMRRVVDGEDGASVTCRVSGSVSFEVSARLFVAGRALVLDGTIAADRSGSAVVTVSDSQQLSTSLVGTSCTLDAKAGAGQNFQIKAGSLWASFSCPTVEAAPNDVCAASGIFVVENCER